ncbi:MAG: hypothetical protein ACRC28_04750 [Clostridium sp.]|uniref:hypothetical protein n=1 Tax=Clostridium sp. TaxID=1506 RepID=UPI003F408425
MYIAPYLLNIKVKNNSNEVIRGLEVSYAEDIGRKARVGKVKVGEETDLIIVTKDIKEDNKLVLKLRNGEEFEVDKEVIENPIDLILELQINEFSKTNLKFESKYVQYSS